MSPRMPKKSKFHNDFMEILHMCWMKGDIVAQDLLGVELSIKPNGLLPKAKAKGFIQQVKGGRHMRTYAKKGILIREDGKTYEYNYRGHVDKWRFTDIGKEYYLKYLEEWIDAAESEMPL